jgi:putative ABC transport system substrate-binding protein
MRRREFIAGTGAAAAAWPLATRAQQGDGVRRIGVLQPQRESDQEAQSWVGAFRERLAALGWREGQNVRIDVRWAAGDGDRFRNYATELVGLKPDVIFCMSTPTVRALQQATGTVPIVFVNANNPVGGGFVASLARPGGNITGFVAFEPAMGGKWLEVLREISPGVARVGLIYNPQTHTGQYFQSIEAAARSLAIGVVRIAFSAAAELERGIDDFARAPNGGMLVLPDSSTRVHRDVIVKLAARHRLPTVYSYRLFITSGGLVYYGTATTEQFRKAAEYVDRIFKGAKPAELPVQAPTKFELVINLKTAKALGLTVPPMLLARADEVIE